MRVFQGRATVRAHEKSQRVKKGRRLELQESPQPTRFQASEVDKLDVWAARRKVELVRELLAAVPSGTEANQRPSSADALAFNPRA